jgi:predicted metal-dependent hydrolase
MKNGPSISGSSGDSPQFEMDFLGGEGGRRIGDSPRDLAPCVRVSRRARRLSVRVYPDARVEVVVPPRARAREVELFVNAHRQWIDDKRTAALRSRPPPEPFPPATIHFQATGESWRLHLAGGEGRLLLAEIDGGKGRILQVSGRVSAAGLRTALRAWLMRAAQSRLAPRVVALSKSTGIPHERVSIRRQRSRWGSCSVRGTISLNACLLFQRPEVIGYLVVHELAHVRHMNHSARFWQAVERHCPGWRTLDRELLDGWRHVPRWVFSDS